MKKKLTLEERAMKSTIRFTVRKDTTEKTDSFSCVNLEPDYMKGYLTGYRACQREINKKREEEDGKSD